MALLHCLDAASTMNARLTLNALIGRRGRNPELDKRVRAVDPVEQGPALGVQVAETTRGGRSIPASTALTRLRSQSRWGIERVSVMLPTHNSTSRYDVVLGSTP